MRRFLLAAALPLLAACVTGDDLPNQPPRVVFFQDSSAALDGSASDVVGDAAALANRNPRARVTVVGYADPLGATQTNTVLSQNRAQAVTRALVANGVAADRISTSAQGETPAPGSLPYPSRRAEIRVLP